MDDTRKEALIAGLRMLKNELGAWFGARVGEDGLMSLRLEPITGKGTGFGEEGKMRVLIRTGRECRTDTVS